MYCRSTEKYIFLTHLVSDFISFLLSPLQLSECLTIFRALILYCRHGDMSLTERVHPTPPPKVAKKADAVEMPRRHLKPPPDAPSSANTSSTPEISQPVTPLQRVSRPTSAADTSTKSQERNSSKKRKHHHKCGLGGESTKHLYQWRLLGIAAIITTSVATVLLVLAFNLEQWEVSLPLFMLIIFMLSHSDYIYKTMAQKCGNTV